MKVAFAGTFAASLMEPVHARLASPCALFAADEAGTIPQLADADVLVSMAFDARVAAAAPQLRLVQVPGAGLDRIDRSALRPGTQLANAYGHETGIAEYIVGAMLGLNRALMRLDSGLRQGRWESQWAIGAAPPPLWPELAGKTLGILGFGRIGQALARRAAAFDMTVRGIRRQAASDPPPGVASIDGLASLDDLLRQADYLAVTLSLSPETRGLLDARRLGLMQPTAYLINVARAEIIDAEALYVALRDRKIAGAALDVWYRYPTEPGLCQPAAQPFHTLDNVIMTPHVSGWTEGMMQARARLIAENIERIARGEAPLNAIGAAP